MQVAARGREAVSSKTWVLNVARSLFAWLLKGYTRKAFWALLLARMAYVSHVRKNANMRPVAGKRCLVTGGASGIGRMIVHELVRKGANVVIWDVNEAGMAMVQREAAQINPECKVSTYRVDLQDRTSIYFTADKVLQNDGQIDTVINNAGIVSGSLFLDTPDDNILRTMKINAISHLWMTKAFLPSMIKRESGNLVCVSSMAGFVGTPRMVDYSCSKFAAIGFHEALRTELRKMNVKGVYATIVAPGHVKTDLFPNYKSQWICPSLTAQEVADETVAALERCDELVMMPRMAYVSLFLKAILPVKLNDNILEITGITSAMDDFNTLPQKPRHGSDIMLG